MPVNYLIHRLHLVRPRGFEPPTHGLGMRVYALCKLKSTQLGPLRPIYTIKFLIYTIDTIEKY